MDRETRNLRAVGMLYMVFGVLYCLIAGFVLAAVEPTDRKAEGIATGLIVFLGAYGVFLFLAGHQLRQYKPWAWWTCAVLSGLGLLNFPIGTGVGIYSLWVLSRPEAPAYFGMAPPAPPLPTEPPVGRTPSAHAPCSTRSLRIPRSTSSPRPP